MTRGPGKETRYSVWPTLAMLGYTLSPTAGKGDLYCHHPILIRPVLGRLPIKMRGLNCGSPKPQPAVGAAADVNLATASSEWGAGEGTQKRSQTVAGKRLVAWLGKPIRQATSVCWALFT